MLFAPFTQEEPFCLNLGFNLEIFLAALFGFLIGVVSGSLGVAGGEFRIPVLIYMFNLDIVDAGTLSLLVSIPTVATGFRKHLQMSYMNRSAAIIAVTMDLGSVLGTIIGASCLIIVDKSVLKILLGTILILATVRMITKP